MATSSGWVKLSNASKCRALELLRNSWIYQGAIAPSSPPIPDCLGSCYVAPTRFSENTTNALSTTGSYSEQYDEARKLCVDVYVGCDSFIDLEVRFDANMQVKVTIDGNYYGESSIACCNSQSERDFPKIAKGSHQICVYWKRSGSTRGVVKILGIVWKDTCSE